MLVNTAEVLRWTIKEEVDKLTVYRENAGGDQNSSYLYVEPEKYAVLEGTIRMLTDSYTPVLDSTGLSQDVTLHTLLTLLSCQAMLYITWVAEIYGKEGRTLDDWSERVQNARAPYLKSAQPLKDISPLACTGVTRERGQYWQCNLTPQDEYPQTSLYRATDSMRLLSYQWVIEDAEDCLEYQKQEQTQETNK